MKTNKFIYILFLAFITMNIASCDEEEIEVFSDKPCLNFTEVNGSYSFIQNQTGEYTFEVPFEIIGDSIDLDRTVKVAVVAGDSLTTADPTEYEIMDGILEAGQFSGIVPIKLIKTDRIDNESINIKLAFVETDEFSGGVRELSEYVLTWTNQVIIPDWKYYGRYCCEYSSTSCYKATIEALGIVEWQKSTISYQFRKTYGIMFGDYVKQWNLDHPDDPLIHDDGEMAGQPIIPIYYSTSIYD